VKMNFIAKQLILGGVIGLMGLGLGGCGGASVSPEHAKQVAEHAQMHTQVAMFGQGSSITTLNYTLGFPIPVNSVVFYEDVNSKQLAFMYNQKRYYLRNAPRYSKTNMDQMLDRYFAPNKVDLSKFTKKEQTLIKAAKIEIGMSKEAVVLAYGFPPVHTTPSLDLDAWKYWKFQRGYAQDTLILHFKNNKLSSIED